MSVLDGVRVSRAPLMTLAAVGVFWGSIAAMMPDIKQAVGASDAVMGAVLVAPAVGSIIAMALAPLLGRALGGNALPVAGLAIVLAFFLPALAGGVVTLGVALFVAGAAVAFADMTANVRIATLEARRGLHLMNLNHAGFSLAFGLTAFAIAFARKAGADYTAVLPVMALVTLGLVLIGWDRRLPAPPAEDDGDMRTAPPWGPVLFTALVLFAAFIGENATEAWSALHIERTLGGAAGEGSFGPATLGFVMAFGRMMGQLVAQRFGETRLILGSAVLASVGALVIAAAPTQGVVLIGVAVLGLGVATIVPSVNSILGRQVNERARPVAISRAWMAGMIGFFIGPSMMGGLAALWNLRVSFAVVAVILALIVPAILALSRRKG